LHKLSEHPLIGLGELEGFVGAGVASSSGARLELRAHHRSVGIPSLQEVLRAYPIAVMVVVQSLARLLLKSDLVKYIVSEHPASPLCGDDSDSTVPKQIIIALEVDINQAWVETVLV
jgi:hypothetical protein